MNRIRKLRTERGFSQKELAEALKTTQQTVGRWETGKAQPSIASLRDLALFLGCRVNDLIANESDVAGHEFALRDVDESFWGHLGVKLHGYEFTKWYPVSVSEVALVREKIFNSFEARKWAVVTTRNNKVLFLHVSKIQRFWLLNDDADPPTGDWDIDQRDYAGLGLETYRGLGEWALEDLGDKVKSGEISEDYAAVIHSYAKEYDSDPHKIEELLYNCIVHFSSGERSSYCADPQELTSLRDDCWMDLVPPMISLSGAHGDFESYYPQDAISMIEAPLLHMLEFEDDLLEEMKDNF